jgi:hypothetical protein
MRPQFVGAIIVITDIVLQVGNIVMSCGVVGNIVMSCVVVSWEMYNIKLVQHNLRITSEGLNSLCMLVM